MMYNLKIHIIDEIYEFNIWFFSLIIFISSDILDYILENTHNKLEKERKGQKKERQREKEREREQNIIFRLIKVTK